MTTLAMAADGAIINSVEFSGTNSIFRQLCDHGKSEMKPHNLAIEKLSQAREGYSQNRQERLDFITKAHRDQRHAE